MRRSHRTPLESHAFRWCLAPLLVVAVVAYASFFAISNLWTIEVPDVRGLDVEHALKRLEAIGLSGTLDPGITGPIHPRTPILDSVPLAGESVLSGGTVVLQLAGSPSDFQAPELIGASIDDAAEKLRKAGFSLGRIWTIDSTEPPGVIAQHPQPGRFTEDRAVSVLVSLGRGETRYVTPRLIGHPQELVFGIWGTRLRRIREIHYKHCDEGNPGEVALQDPEPGMPLGEEGLRIEVCDGQDVTWYSVVDGAVMSRSR